MCTIVCLSMAETRGDEYALPLSLLTQDQLHHRRCERSARTRSCAVHIRARAWSKRNDGDADGLNAIMTSDFSQNLWKADEPSPNAPQPPSLPGLKVIRLLGAGGFGAVWLCEQQGPLLRQVAVKVMRTVIAGPRLRQRFESERRLLARMDHPGIAQVFDAGESQDGSVYFIMELVEGEPILDWCDRNRLSVESRLGLMRQVAMAVQHAHTKGIIHLDLKSANILVREVDPLESQLYVVISGECFVGPGEMLSFASVSTKHLRLSFPYL